MYISFSVLPLVLFLLCFFNLFFIFELRVFASQSLLFLGDYGRYIGLRYSVGFWLELMIIILIQYGHARDLEVWRHL